PLVTAALHRLLLAVLHRSLMGPASIKEKADLFRAGRLPSAAIEAYLARWHERFDLFHPERPFFQHRGLPHKASSVAKLRPESGAGSNPPLFEHSLDEPTAPLSMAAAARALVTMQSFALSGTYS